MALEMKPQCERCDAALAAEGEAFICSYECSFCPGCADAMGHVCPNCGGDLVRRPRRRKATRLSRAQAIARAQALTAPYLEDESRSADAFIAARRRKTGRSRR